MERANLLPADSFLDRHIGPDEDEQQEMLKAIGLPSLDALIDETIPRNIRLSKPLNLSASISEHELLQQLREMAAKNKMFKSYIGLGFYDCITPSVILRNIFENPGWYTQYTPYQSEISQGRLEALLNFQTMVSDLTGMEVTNASLLDEGTAAAEAMSMIHRINAKKNRNPDANVFVVSDTCFPQTIDVLKSRAEPQGFELQICDISNLIFHDRIFGALIQYPDSDGFIENYASFIQAAHEADVLVAVAADLLSLTLLTPPGEFGADIVFGSAQRFGVPMGYGGPHAAFFGTKNDYKRQMPGRIIGVSLDRHGQNAYRMALQTREQHIRREKATSNICTAQALLAIMAGMYAVYHGPKRLKKIAQRVHTLTQVLAAELTQSDRRQVNKYYFDTLKIELASINELEEIRQRALNAQINFRYFDGRYIGISLDETTTPKDAEDILAIFSGEGPLSLDWDDRLKDIRNAFPVDLVRTSEYLTHPVFTIYHSETKMMRYIKRLENRDLSLTTSMIPLGSCTMKLNAATEMLPVSWPEFSRLHPFVPADQAEGYAQLFKEVESDLNEITGFAATSLQPNSGAQGEFTGLSVIRAYHVDRGQSQRNVVLIPSSAHGTNPASAVMAGMRVLVVICDDCGNIDLDDLKEKAVAHRDTLSALMVTYPSTHGVFEENIVDICKIVHDNGGQVYMDGANMNAQVGLTTPAIIGADICHLNLHKTFGIPHGGGGPGMGPICVAKHLKPYLPGNPLIKVGGEKAIPAVCSTPWGSSNILVISYAYIKMMGPQGLTEASKVAILNSNYIVARLKDHYKLLYKGERGRVGHEMIFDLRTFKSANIEAEDLAKRLMDYGFHAPTVSFPVLGSFMIEPTESEDKRELDRFCDAMNAIKMEIQDIMDGKADPEDNLLKNAPHTTAEVCGNDWNHPYSREQAAYSLPYLKEQKFWTHVARIDNTYGDRNLVCTCPPQEELA